jgi:hypothetical protein
MGRQFAGFHAAGCVLAVGLVLTAGRLARAEDTSLVAGAWKVTLDDGTVQEYEITSHGNVTRTIGNVKTTGQTLRQQEGHTGVTFHGTKEFARMWVQGDGTLLQRQYDHKVDEPNNEPAKVGKGVRLKDMDPNWATQPNVRIADFAGQWSIPYGNGAFHNYEFDKNGKMTCLANGTPWTGQRRHPRASSAPLIEQVLGPVVGPGTWRAGVVCASVIPTCAPKPKSSARGGSTRRKQFDCLHCTLQSDRPLHGTTNEHLANDALPAPCGPY